MRSIVSRSFGILLGSVLFVLGGPRDLWAVRPIHAPYALAAGSSVEGDQDGIFSRARFSKPYGLAISPDGKSLFVADAGNHNIRELHLDDKNRVTTLAGTGKPGNQDGPLASATFKEPRSVAVLPGNRLLVNDRGNGLLRLIDIEKGTVSTLGGGKGVTLRVGPVSQVSMEGVQDMVYLPDADSVFYTQPDKSSINRLDMATSVVSVVADNTQGLLQPFALAVSGKTLFVSERDYQKLYSFLWDGKTMAGPTTLATPTGNIMSMAQGGMLYGLQNGIIPLSRLNPPEAVPFMSLSGDDVPPAYMMPFANQSAWEPSGLAVDPLDPRKLFVTNPTTHNIYTIRDTYRNFAYAGSNVSLLDPPAQKDPRIFRILYVGDSRSTMIVPYPFSTTYNVQDRKAFPAQAGTAKRLEQELNFRAALDDAPMDFEVTSLGQSATEPLFLWPNYLVPQEVERNSIDLVIIMEPPTVLSVFPFIFYFMNPITKEGIPSYPKDMEYLLKPPAQRIPDGTPRRFYDLCKKHGVVKIEGSNFVFDQKLFFIPELHEPLLELYGKPIDLLQKKLALMKNSRGEPVRVLVCASHSYLLKPNSEPPDIWSDVCQKYQVPLLDVNDAMSSFMFAYYPIAEVGGNDHFNPDGHTFFGRLLAEELIEKGLVPWSAGTGK